MVEFWKSAKRNRLLRAGGSAILLAAVLGGCGTPAIDTVQSGDFVTASDESLARKRARIRLELAVGYYNDGKTTIALDELKQSIAADPSLLEAHNLRGLIYMRLNDLGLAEESFRKALQIDPQAAAVEHNYGWLLCQQGRTAESFRHFQTAIANPSYADKAKSLMTLGVCQSKAGQKPEAEQSLQKAFELDATNPVIGYNLALLLYQRGEFTRSLFYVRRINNSEFANAESLWLGIRIERKLGNTEAVGQLGTQLKKRFPQSNEASLYDRAVFND
ncbi:MAG: type IV pilus biogenesis/stability protein PilW [Rhodoferax sp.]|nr:type IV pilus biogenesis/stability protein PilW [Rhodoferax sp.]